MITLHKIAKKRRIKKMLNNKYLSYWEKSIYFEEVDFTIIGAGIVGLSTAIYLKEKFPASKVLILERGYLPSGASTKNAGFACFGSPTELHDDLQNISEENVWETFKMRLNGLKTLFELIDPKRIDYEKCGSWDLISKKEEMLPTEFIDYINEKAFKICGESKIYTEDKIAVSNFGFQNIYSTYKNKEEGTINSGKLISELYSKATNLGVLSLFGIEVKQFETNEKNVYLETNHGDIKSVNLIICTNGFAKQFLDEDIQPARAQVLITKPIDNLKINGSFHYDAGYYYFRNIDKRILFGGGRNLDFKNEATEEFGTSSKIQNSLLNLLQTVILPNTKFEVDYAWSGIMGIGNEKKPIIKKTNNNVAFGVRMGGMGIAIGAEVGKSLSKLF